MGIGLCRELGMNEQGLLKAPSALVALILATPHERQRLVI